MDITQNGKDFTFKVKIVDADGKQLTINNKGEYVVDGGSGSGGNPWTVASQDDQGNPTGSSVQITGIANTSGSGITFEGDDLVNVVTTPDGDKTVVKVTINDTDADGNTYTLKTYNVKEQGEYLTNNVVEAISKMNEQGIKFFHTNEDENFVPVAQDHNQVDSSASGGLATAIGVKAKASGKQSLAIGSGAEATGEQSISIGTGNKVSGNHSGAFGDPSIIDGDNSYSVGNGNKVATNNTFVLGNNVTDTAANSVFLGNNASQKAVGAGATGTVKDATVGGITYSGFAGETSVGMVSVGNDKEVRRISGVAAGEISATSTDAINGSQLYAVLPDYVDGDGTTVTIGNTKDGRKTVQVNVLPGHSEGIVAGDNVHFDYEDNKDAAGNQLYVTTTGGTTTDANDPNVKLDANGDPVKQQTTVINAKQPDLRPIEQHVQQVENNAYAGVAQAMATAGLPQAYLPGKSMVAVAGGHYKGETGYALGVSSISDSGNWVFKATASGNSRGNVGGTIGAGYQW